MSSARPLLITGFEPFGGDQLNPSAEIARSLSGRTVAGKTVVSDVLPCVFGLSSRRLQSLLRRHRPELVLCLGLAGGRNGLTLERVALNINDARIPDNAGARPIDEPIVKSGPAAYWSTLPIKAMTRAIALHGIEASVSQTAGTFVCNHVFYGLMRSLKRQRGVRGGFLHVPYLPEQLDDRRRQAPSMPLTQMIRGVEIALETALTTGDDITMGGGALS